MLLQGLRLQKTLDKLTRPIHVHDAICRPTVLNQQLSSSANVVRRRHATMWFKKSVVEGNLQNPHLLPDSIGQYRYFWKQNFHSQFILVGIELASVMLVLELF
jgi:hypothetical protein